jgi:hypothetical protein
MNRMFAEAASRRERRTAGALARLAGRPTLDTSPSRQECMNALLVEREAAMRSGDEDSVAFVDHKIDRLFDESRAGRKPVEPEQPPPSFDGGVRGRRSVAPPGGGRIESSTELLMRSFMAHRVERRERGADSGQTVVVGGLSNF